MDRAYCSPNLLPKSLYALVYFLARLVFPKDMTNRLRRYEPGLPATIDASHHYLIVVDLLGQGDLKTAWIIAESAADQAVPRSATAYSRYVKIHNRPMLDALLADIAEQASESNIPLIAFDGHGCPNRGLLIAPTNVYVPWLELQAALRRINERTHNGTGVILSTCYGMAVCSGIQITQPAPFQFCIAPKSEVKAGIVETQMQLFIETMLKTHSMDLAIQHLQPHYDFFHSHIHLYSHFIGYLRKHTHGSGRKKFMEELTTKILHTQPGDKKDVKAARQAARAAIVDQRAHFTRLSSTFLHGRNSLTFEQINEYAKKWPVAS